MSREETRMEAGGQHGLEFSRAGGIFALNAGLWLPPVAWFVQFQTNYALVAIACAHHSRLMLYVVTLLFLAASAGGGLLSWNNWKKAGGRWEHESGGPAPRSRFVAMVGVLAAVLFSLVILAQGIAAAIIEPCLM